MKRLIAGIEREPTLRACNAVDRSEPTKWRRTVTERVPHRVAIFHGSRMRPKMRPNRPITAIIGWFSALQRLLR